MGNVTTKQLTSKEVWEKFLLRHEEANFLQSWEWGEFHERLGNKIARTGFYIDKKLVGVMLSIVERARRAIYLTIPGGPIIDWNNSNLKKKFRDEAILIARENNCSFIRVRPQLEKSKNSIRIFKSLGFKSAPMHLHAEQTSQLDLSNSLDEILVHMRKATRYEIRKAEKIGLRVEESRDPKSIKRFYALELETAKRQKFVPFSFNFLQEQFKVFTKNDHAILYSAYIGKKLLAQAFIIFYNSEAVYHYGASTNAGRKFPGAYIIQWRAITEAKKRGIKRYNFWGVANDPKHRFYSLSTFKRGFGGVEFEYLHAHDYVINKPRYLLNFLIEWGRKKIRRV